MDSKNYLEKGIYITNYKLKSRYTLFQDSKYEFWVDRASPPQNNLIKEFNWS